MPYVRHLNCLVFKRYYTNRVALPCLAMQLQPHPNSGVASALLQQGGTSDNKIVFFLSSFSNY